ncbi:hypothetical protein RQP46_001062 [Phenoliferia psychrophenolica]
MPHFLFPSLSGHSGTKHGADVVDALRGIATLHHPPSPLPSLSASPPVASGSSRELASLLGIPQSPRPTDNSDNSDDADGTGGLSNPLGLLSDACIDAGPMRNGNGMRRGPNVGAALSLSDLGVLPDDIAAHMDGIDYIYRSVDGEAVKERDRHSEYFKPVNLEYLEVDDVGLDPIAEGIVTEEEVVELFAFYHTFLRPVTLALDPVVCTPKFLRATSPFLLTAICASASNFLPTGNSGLTIRLFKHFNKIADQVKIRGYRSVSIIHAFTLGCGWASPAPHISREQSWAHLTHAHSIAIELGLHGTFSKVKTPVLDTLPWAEELRLWGPDPTREGAERLQRHAARAWLHLYIWGSGLARTMARPWVIGADEFGPRLDNWHDGSFAIPEDRTTVAIVHLRAMCSFKLIPHITSGETSYSELRIELHSAFDAWQRKWLGLAEAPLAANSAVCAARCLALLKPDDQTIALYVTSLLGKLSLLMVEAGQTPKHRLGTCYLCGEHLRVFLVRHGHTLLPTQLPQSVVQSPQPADSWLPFVDASGWFLDQNEFNSVDFGSDLLWNG